MPNHLVGHKEYAPLRKVDPGHMDMDFHRLNLQTDLVNGYPPGFNPTPPTNKGVITVDISPSDFEALIRKCVAEESAKVIRGMGAERSADLVRLWDGEVANEAGDLVHGIGPRIEGLINAAKGV